MRTHPVSPQFLFAFALRVGGRRLLPGTLALTLLLLPASARSAAVVDTVTGGPSQFYPQTPYGYVDGNTATDAKFHTPAGCALDPSGTYLFVADRDNNVVRRLNLPGNVTITFAPAWTNRLSQPVAVAVDGATNVYVLNHGNGSNGRILKFSAAGSLLATNAVNLTNATALALDALTNLYVTVSSNRILRISPGGAQTLLSTITHPGVWLQGIAILDNGVLVVSDAGNHGLWRVDPFTGAWAPLSGFNGAGDFFGPPEVAQFRSPAHLARAANNLLVVADRGNHRVKLVDAAGNASLLYGVRSNFWVQGSPAQGIFPGWWDGPVCESDTFGCEESREPWGVTIAPNGDVFTTEAYWHVIRQVTSTGLGGPGAPGVAPQFNQPGGIALDSTGNFLFVADSLNNAVLRLNFGDNSTGVFATTNLNKPVAVALDNGDNLYVLNQAAGTNGYVLRFNKFGNLLGTNALNLTNATALALDGSTNLLIAERAGRIKRVPAGGGPATVLVTLTNAGIQLEGLVVKDDGTLAVSDAGNHAVWLVNPVSLNITLLTGNNGPGRTVGTAPFAQLDQPHHLARAGNGILVIADFANDRVAVVDTTGTLTELPSTNSAVWFGRSGDPVTPGQSRFVPMQQPAGIVVAPNGDVITAEWFNHNVRRIFDTGLSGPGGGSGTNGLVVTPPSISPNFGYYPMGRLITVSSPNPDVFYTTDGSEPTTNSARVAMNGNTGFIVWVNHTNDLTALRVKAFVQTNASATVSGVPAPTNSVGVPPGLYGELQAGIGSTIIVPVVANLRTNDRVRSYQFKVEVVPEGGAPMISDQFRALDVGSNDFIRVVTAAQGGATATISFVPYTNGSARGLQITAIGTNANVNFQRFAVVALLAVPIPGNAAEGQSYTVRVLNSSATSDGVASPVEFPPMPAATIRVTNVLYTVGDSAGAAWYNAGEFGNTNLDNGDVNNAFYAAAGLRLPYPFSDVFDSMDAYPEDEPNFVGGDGEIRFLDWQVILKRSLRQVPYADGTNNWQRAWAFGGNRTNQLFSLPIVAPPPPPGSPPPAPWNRQALVAAVPVGYALAGSTVDVPVFVKTADGATLSGLQFRCVVTPQNGGPALSTVPTFIPAAGLPAPLQQGFRAGETAVGWALGSFSFGSHTSNFLGVVRFVCPSGAQPGHAYTVAFANADGAPDLQTPYRFETRRASALVGMPAPPLADPSSDEWKLHFFGSLDGRPKRRSGSGWRAQLG